MARIQSTSQRAAGHTQQHRACVSEEPAAAGEVNLGPAGSPSLPAHWAGSGSTGENHLSFAVCRALSQPTVSSSICQEKDLLNASPI